MSFIFISRDTQPTTHEHPDHFILAPDEKGSIKIEAVKTFIAWTNLKPFSKRTKLGVIQQFHTATREAQNALLKTLEEPPPHTTILVHTDDEKNILSTILSRCRLCNTQNFPDESLTTSTFANDQNTDVSEKILALCTANSTPSVTTIITTVEEIASEPRQVVLTALDHTITNLYQTDNYSDKNCALTLLNAKKHIMRNMNIRLALEDTFFTFFLR